MPRSSTKRYETSNEKNSFCNILAENPGRIVENVAPTGTGSVCLRGHLIGLQSHKNRIINVQCGCDPVTATFHRDRPVRDDTYMRKNTNYGSVCRHHFLMAYTTFFEGG